MESQVLVLFEHATGYNLFRLTEFEEVGNLLPQVEASILDVTKFSRLVQLIAFCPFQNAAHALDNCNAVSEGNIHLDLLNFLESNIPPLKKLTTTLGVGDSKLGSAISEQFPYIKCVHTGAIPEVIRGIRFHYTKLVKRLASGGDRAAQLGLGHSYSRAKVKFNVNRVDNMIIQAIALVDQLDKDINLFTMRIREWYSYHFPELFKLVPDQLTFCHCVKFIQDKKTLTTEKFDGLTEIVADEDKAQEIFSAAHSSMGMDISPIDLINIDMFSERIIDLIEFRKEMQEYLKQKMEACAPNLMTITGEQVGARLISQAGSLNNLAKIPASTIQILGAEKALFRALKTRGL
ncbi:unnamed protein product [Soboliphyme baturini]|uniref:Nucleolar protein 56 n=1 Tax=Soboliphyme baturini TaxID=241478 RepID=A0A183IIR9_9BILA|nr:unnamed protein product [Soboliphyme baturini]